MKRIPLKARDGRIRVWALVDDADFAWLNRWRWCLHSEGYACRTEWIPEGGGKQRTIMMHVEIVGCRVDHRDRNRLNNQRLNLRPATQAKNLQNQGLRSDNTSGYRGVSRRKGEPPWKEWQANVKLDGKIHFLGLFGTPEEADVAARVFRAERMPFSDDATQITA